MPRARNQKTATAARPTSSGKSVDAIVLLDLYAWHDKSGDPTTPLHEAHKGDEVTVSVAEFDRSQTMTPKGLAKKNSPEHRRFELGAAPTEAAKYADLSDAELRAIVSLRGIEGVDEMNRDELLGAVFSAPGSDRPQP